MDNIIKKYVDFTKRWEGGLTRDVADSASKYPCPTPYNGKFGWHTNVGITYKVWVSVFGKNNDKRFYEMSDNDWFNVFKTLYWNGVRGDEYKNISIAIIVTGMAWGSGKKQSVKTLQNAIKNLGNKIDVDGVLGNTTIRLANECNPRDLFDEIIRLRGIFFKKIAVGKNAKFKNGWLNRLEDYRKTFRPEL